MANPIVAFQKPAASSYTILYECPNTATYAIVSAKILNSSTTNSSAIHLAVGTTATNTNPTPNGSEYIEYNTTLSPLSNMERSSIIMKPGEKIVCFGTTGDVVYRVHGLSRTTSQQSVAVGNVVPSPNSWTTVYSVPNNVGSATVNYATVHVNAVNTSNSPATLDIAIAPSANPSGQHYIEQGETLQAQGDGIIHTCLVVKPGENILTRSSAAGVAVRVNGIIDLTP